MHLYLIPTILALVAGTLGAALGENDVPAKNLTTNIYKISYVDCQVSDIYFADTYGESWRYTKIVKRLYQFPTWQPPLIEAGQEKGCRLYTCYGRSAVYLCTQGAHTHEISFPREELAADIESILSVCTPMSQNVMGRAIEKNGKFSIELHGHHGKKCGSKQQP